MKYQKYNLIFIKASTKEVTFRTSKDYKLRSNVNGFSSSSFTYKRLYKQNRQRMQSEINKNLNIKIVLLKQPNQNKSFYAFSQINEELRNKMSFNDPRKNHHKITSIAYLSSIIQDDNLIEENHNYSLNESTHQEIHLRNQKYSASFQQQSQLFKLLKPRQKGRQLSCLLQNSQQRNKIYRSKTEGIDKIIEDRKLMPINRLKVGTKNIKFSSKNKQQLTKDFNEFVINKEARIDLKNEHSERDNILYQKRRIQQKQPRKRTLWLANIQNELKNLSSFSQEKEMTVKSISPKKVRREQEVKYANYLKRLKSSIPQIDHFGWCKLNKTPFKLKSH